MRAKISRMSFLELTESFLRTIVLQIPRLWQQGKLLEDKSEEL
jgi:hypothetical protein